MAIVYSTEFDATVDTNLTAYGAPDWYALKGAAGALVVSAADDNVQTTVTATAVVSCGLVHSLIGGIADYQVTGTIRRQSFDQMGGVIVRCGVVGSGNCYAVMTDFVDDLYLFRMVGGALTLLKTKPLTAVELPAPLTMEMSITVTGTDPVSLSYSLNGQTDSFDDSNAARLVSGPPGVMAQRGAAPQAQVWVTSFSVDDLGAGGGGGDVVTLGNLGPAMFGSINNEPHRQPVKPQRIEKVPQNPEELLAREAEIRRKMELAADLASQSREIEQDQRLRAASLVAERLNRFR